MGIVGKFCAYILLMPHGNFASIIHVVSRNSSVVNNGGFLVSPAPLTVAVDTEAVFHCQHLNSNITWRINGIAVRVFPDIVVIHHSGNNSTLTITARPEFNEAMVECVAGNSVLDIASASMVIQGTRISDTLNYLIIVDGISFIIMIL